MKLRNLPLLIVTSLLLAAPQMSEAAVPWVATPTAAYTAYNQITLTADTTINSTSPAFDGISVTATADQPGLDFRAMGGAAGQIRFENANPIGMGEMITFDFQFNMQLSSGVRPFGVAGNTRAAALLCLIHICRCRRRS